MKNKLRRLGGGNLVLKVRRIKFMYILSKLNKDEFYGEQKKIISKSF